MKRIFLIGSIALAEPVTVLLLFYQSRMSPGRVCEGIPLHRFNDRKAWSEKNEKDFESCTCQIIF